MRLDGRGLGVPPETYDAGDSTGPDRDPPPVDERRVQWPCGSPPGRSFASNVALATCAASRCTDVSSPATSVGVAHAPPSSLLNPSPKHRAIDQRHYRVRDRTFDQDGSLVRNDMVPQTMTSLRHLATRQPVRQRSLAASPSAAAPSPGSPGCTHAGQRAFRARDCARCSTGRRELAARYFGGQPQTSSRLHGGGRLRRANDTGAHGSPQHPLE